MEEKEQNVVTFTISDYQAKALKEMTEGSGKTEGEVAFMLFLNSLKAAYSQFVTKELDK